MLEVPRRGRIDRTPDSNEAGTDDSPRVTGRCADPASILWDLRSPTTLATGVHLCVAADGDPVCLDCGRQHAPALAALLHLAGEAERIARIGRHTVFPPLTALLDLARAADNYHQTATATCSPQCAVRRVGIGR